MPTRGAGFAGQVTLGVRKRNQNSACHASVAAIKPPPTTHRSEAGIRAGLQAMYESGRLVPHADPDALAMAILAAMQGGLLLTQLNRDTRPLEQSLDAVLSLVASLTVHRP